MKTTTVPAQVTTIEDKIAGRLGLTQLLLLTIPIFIAGMIFAILPHRMHAAPYKYVLSGFVCALVGTLAIRIKEKLVLNWCLILFNFYKRPKWYVYDKNNQYCRDLRVVVFDSLENSGLSNVKELVNKSSILSMTIYEQFLAEEIISKEGLNIIFKTAKKGHLDVIVTKNT